MRIYLKNNGDKVHPFPIWNDGALGLFEECRPNNKNNNNKMSSNIGSVNRIVSVLKTHALKPLCPPLYNILQYNY